MLHLKGNKWVICNILCPRNAPKPLRRTTEKMFYLFLCFTKETFSSFSSWMKSLREIVRIPGLFAVIIYSFKVIIRHRWRNGRSSAPLLPSPSASHYYNIAALKQLPDWLTSFEVHTKPLVSPHKMADWLIAFSDKRKKLAGGEDTAPADTKLFVNLNLQRQLFISQVQRRKTIC